jgi:hypothetical protein
MPSYSDFLPARRATAFKLTASEIGPVLKKFESGSGPPRAAAIHWRIPAGTLASASAAGQSQVQLAACSSFCMESEVDPRGKIPRVFRP